MSSTVATFATGVFITCALLSVIITTTTVNSTETYSQIASSKTNHIVIAPRFVRPSTIYNVAVFLLDEKPQSVNVYTSLSRNGEEIAAASQTVTPRLLQTIPLKVPMSISDGDYHLKVEGSNGGALVFRNITELEFTPRFLSIVVQTTRPIYRAGQEVRFRVLVLQTDLRPFDDGMEIYVIDPDGFIMRRWVSAYTNNGVSSLKFKLPKMAKDGYWKIRIKAWEQIDEHKIRVETYFSPLFEVHVKWLPYVLESDEKITAHISGLFTSEKIARGNATLKLFGRNLVTNETFKTIWSDRVFIKEKDYEISFTMDQVQTIMGKLDNLELRLEVDMTEFMSGETVTGYSHTRIIPSKLHLRFLSSLPAVFKPGMPFHSQVAITYQDNEPVPPEIIATSRLRIQITVGLDTGGQITLPDIIAGAEHKVPPLSDDDEENLIDYNDSYMKQIFANQISQEKYMEEGIFPFHFDTPHNADYIILTASYINEDGRSLETRLNVVKYFSPIKKYLTVWTSTKDALTDEYVIFHVKSNFRMDSLQYLILSKDQILSAGEQSVYSISPTVTTMNVPVSAAMAPGFRLLVFHVSPQGELLADSCFVPVDGFTRYETELELNTGKDFKAERVEVRVSGDEGAFIAVQTSRSSVYMLQAGNELTHSRVTDSLMAFENFTKSVHKVRWRSREGSVADKSMYFSSMDYGLDVNQTFMFSGLAVFSTLTVSVHPNSETCRIQNELPCGLMGCYSLIQKCDGIQDCKNGEDETDCTVSEDNDYEYRVTRMSRFTFLYDDEYGDWGWREIRKNDHEGIEFEPLTAPPMADDWYFTAFSASNRLGFTIISEPVVFSSKRPFIMHVSGPSSCHRGEQLGLRLILINNDESEALVLLRLIGSPDYKFVHVEEGGVVSSYGARLSSGDHQLLVYLAPETQEHIDFPVAPTVEQGDVDITFVASTQSGRSTVTHTITVIGEGAMINKHTSVFLDLKSRALVLRYLDIIVEESPLVPYQEWRRYVFGSTKASLTLTGDIIGPAFPQIPVTTKSILGREAKGTEARVFELAANIWTLHYLRLTNQLRPAIMKEVLEECNALFANIMKRFNPAGWFHNWDTSEPSVWLTAWVIRIFKHATFPDWENNLYIQPAIFERALSWILQFQTTNGSFLETAAYNTPLDSKINSNRSDVVLTAHVLITLTECVELVTSGNVRTAAGVASQGAARYLEHLLHSLSDPYHISITTYALTLSKSSEKDLALILLQQKQRQNTEGLIYWSNHDIPANPIKLENQRPFTRPRVYHESDSLAVEATAWALLVILSTDGVTDTAEKIVQWLNSVRMTNSGFISTVDTAVALQALTEYAFRARLLDITNINVAVEMPTAGKFREVLHIGNSSFIQPEAIEIPKVWGHINIVAKGAGQAVVQMDVNYGIDHEPLTEVPTYPCFSLKLTEYYSTFRNKSAITIQSCFRWTREWPETSGAAVLEIEIPTGYHLLESEAELIAKSGIHPTLRDGRTIEGKTIWFFERIYSEWTCFNHTVRRWFPVANMTLHRQALLYESTARERFVQVLFNSTPLYVLNICEVCGSFQCPYCPFYNTAAQLSSLFILPTLLLICLYKSSY